MCYDSLRTIRSLSGLSFGSFLSAAMTAQPMLTMDMLHHSLHSFWIILLTCFHLYLIATNLTTNEVMNGKKYYWFRDGSGRKFNPFDRGVLRNFKQFFFEHKPQDFDGIYEAQKMRNV